MLAAAAVILQRVAFIFVVCRMNLGKGRDFKFTRHRCLLLVKYKVLPIVLGLYFHCPSCCNCHAGQMKEGGRRKGEGGNAQQALKATLPKTAFSTSSLSPKSLCRKSLKTWIKTDRI